MPGQANVQNIAHDCVPFAGDELMNMNEPGKRAMDGLLAKSKWRVEQRVPESQNHGNESRNHRLDPGLIADLHLIVVVQQPDSRPTRMQDFESRRVFEESENLLAAHWNGMCKTKAHAGQFH